jgi:protein MpaA
MMGAMRGSSGRRKGRIGRIGLIATTLAAIVAISLSSGLGELAEAAAGRDHVEDVAASGRSRTTHADPAPTPAASPSLRRVVLGRSVQGRPIVALELGNPTSRRRFLVVGCIHGDERAGIAIAKDLGSDVPPTRFVIWIVPNLNPDGSAANTRQNGRGVDLNRNFPYRWRPAGRPWDRYYPGLRPLSEPESRIAFSLIRRVRPSISVWFHQPLGLVDRSGGRSAIEWRYSMLVGLPLRRLPRYPGSATTWENHRFLGSTSFVVELPGGGLSARAADRYADGLLNLFSRSA